LQGRVTDATSRGQIKEHLRGCAMARLAAGDPIVSRQLARASTHWPRHTHASHALASGVSVEVAQQDLGHASLVTTSLYITKKKAQRLRAMSAFWSHRNRADR